MPSPTRHPEYFDYPVVARAAKISDSDLTAIEALVRAEYSSDQMMFELRMLRICRAIHDGVATVQDALLRKTPGQSEAA